MKRLNLLVAFRLVLTACTTATAAPVEFTLVTHAENATLLPQPNAVQGVSGDHLLRTADDITGASYNPSECFSFNFMNPAGASPPGYAEGIHSMTGSFVLDVDLVAGGALGINELAFDGFITLTKSAYQRLVKTGDRAADGSHGPVNGQPNTGSYVASGNSNWAFTATIDWYYDTPFGQHPSIDMTFNDYQWNGFIVPISELTPAGMAATALDDFLGYFGGTSENFESWLLTEIAPRLPSDAQYLLFAQGEAHPDWVDGLMGMTTDGIVGQTVIAYASVPEPGTAMLLAIGLSGLIVGKRLSRKSQPQPGTIP